jgi:hypothetical protein
VTDAEQPVTASLRLTDNDSGVSIVFMDLRHRESDASVFTTAALSSGTATDGTWTGNFIVPKNSPPGEWELAVTAWDAAFNLAEILTGTVLTVTGVGDTTPPVVSGTPTIDPSSVDLTSGPQVVTVQVPLTDDVSGVSWAAVDLIRGDVSYSTGFGTLISGDALDGIWEFDVRIEQDATSGSYTLHVTAADEAGNFAEIPTSATLQVSGGDTTGPALSSTVTMDQNVVDVSTEPATVILNAPLVDDISGVQFAYALFRRNGDELSNSYGELVSGTPVDGIWRIEAIIFQDAAPGAWEVFIVAGDNAYNESILATGLTLTVTGGDVDPPALAGPIVVNPTTVDLSDPEASVLVEATLTDAGTGVMFVETYISRAGDDRHVGPLGLTSGDAFSGTWAAQLVLDPFISEGDWEVFLFAYDAAGNASELRSGTILTLTASDREPPVLVSSSVSPASADLTAGAATVSVSATMSDASGVSWVDFGLVDSEGATVVFRSGALGSENGDESTWIASFDLDVASGTYTLHVSATDHASNQLEVLSGESIAVVMRVPDPASGPVPADGAIQVEGNARLTWAPAFGARTYEVFIWPSGTNRPSVPEGSAYSALFVPSSPLHYGADYQWQVISLNPEGSTEGPVWTFATRTVPDLVVTEIVAPGSVFSGQSIDVSWTVTNQGVSGTTAPSWSDVAYLSADLVVDPRVDVRLARLPNLSVLGPGESYRQTISFEIPERQFGTFNVLVRTGDGQEESNKENNLAAQRMQINLPPPPDLVPGDLAAPPTAFSGTEVNVQWTVTNAGQSFAKGAWTDELFLSPSESPNAEGSTSLVRSTRVPDLASSETYSEQHVVPLPGELSGELYFVLVTDVDDEVFEQTDAGEGNNVVSIPVSVILSPPPDLVVQQVTVPESANSGQSITAEWRVHNAGPGVAAGSWKDRVFYSESLPFERENAIAIGSFRRNAELAPDASYTRAAEVTIPDAAEGPGYVIVVADAANDVFEHDFEDNNSGSSLPVAVSMSPWADLRVDQISVPDAIGETELFLRHGRTASTSR